jgi:SulP family sulfate permease
LTIKTLKNDILAGITVAIVALPLALAFGVVSGAGAIAGLYGAIILGFIAALLGGVAGWWQGRDCRAESESELGA